MSIILGFLAGVGLPIQTSVNTRLRKKVGSPYNASLVSFVVALLFLSALLLITGQGLHIPLAQLLNEPAWIWIGGICGLVFLTGNILLFSKLGSRSDFNGLDHRQFCIVLFTENTAVCIPHCWCGNGNFGRSFGFNGKRK